MALAENNIDFDVGGVRAYVRMQAGSLETTKNTPGQDRTGGLQRVRLTS